ncbi:MAG: FAD-dependent oxidoreductase [Bacteroidia bacterium]|nr:FAD-dependent oxidoreductase [Bacteroidia bacterium]
MDKPQQILIVGQGLAGTLLSYQFLTHNIEHKVVDNHHANSSTLAAAGLVNPITGRRYVKSWMIDELLDFAKPIYRGLERLLDIKLVTHLEVIRSLQNVSQENLWNTATSRPGYNEYASDNDSAGSYTGFVNQRFAYRRIKQALQVNVSELIKAYRLFLQEKDMLIDDDFNFSFKPEMNEFSLYNTRFSHIVFCEGYKAVENPFFNYLPFQPSKGESFELEIHGLIPMEILRDEIFLVPMGENRIWSGGGYAWKYDDDFPSEKFSAEWTKKLDDLLMAEYRINTHRAGVRPSVKGRRPLLGKHPLYERLIIFNGLGTKGTSLGPYFANHLYEYLFEDGQLLNEVNIQRFDVK